MHTLNELQTELKLKGIDLSHSILARYARSGLFKAVKLPGATGTWVVNDLAQAVKAIEARNVQVGRPRENPL